MSLKISWHMKLIDHNYFICHFFIAIFLCFLKNSIRQDMTHRKKPDDLL